MSNLLYTYETVEAMVEEDLWLYRNSLGKKKCYRYELALLELLYEPSTGRHYIICLDLAATPAKPARCWPMRSLTEWAELTAGRGEAGEASS